MKAFVNSMFMVIIAIAVSSCAEDAAQDEPLRFLFKINPIDNATTDLPPQTSLMISLETPSGEPVYTLEKISYSREGSSYSSSGLDLQPGQYVLTEFVLVDQSGDITHTIPDVNSRLKSSVSNPLGINITLDANNAKEIATEVLHVSKHSPADFGLASFRTENSFQLLVSEDGGKSVSATASVLAGTDTVASFDLPAKKSRISFDGDLNTQYTLIISREACAPFVQDFTLAEWSSEYWAKPFRVELAPAFTMTAQAGASLEFPFYFYLGGESMNISINWGDGETQDYSINDPQGVEITHAYAAAGTYPISITGDIEKITHFYSFYGGSVFSEIAFRHLTNLREILYGLTYCPNTIDLSHNTKLQFAMLPGLMNLQTLILPENHEIRFIEVDGDNQLNTEDIDAIINNIYTNSSAANIREGTFGLRASWAQPEDDLGMVGPPSAETMVLLQSLRDDYGWLVNPSASGSGRTAQDSRIEARRRI
jgi:hypothetical protein